ncbi:hypothetical protein [Frigidibacter sp. ROC022]|uniref:hypothetical protein n=1 Tax=Frigidibacter sp. ROC022 TaxID=2971796 RepID=UPI00215AA945|nr:hypothetical protein [Frigidibacter sp. ROC022]MCR8725182.1 hypothetical protein [Frigidibacter sp. ROC022]
MTLNHLPLPSVALAALLALPLAATADDGGGTVPPEPAQAEAPPPGGPQGGPPPREAFEACEARVENDSCSVTGPEGTKLDGACRLPLQGRDDAMLCVPDGAGPRG